MAKLNVGVVGAGLIGKDHANTLHRRSQVASVTVFDEDAKRGEELAAKHGLRTARSLDALIKECDVIWICTPPFAHRALVEKACAAKKAIFCEKPLAHQMDDANAIRAAVRAAGVPFFMGQSGRFTVPFMLIKKLVDEGAVGKPTLLYSTRIGRLDPKAHPAWRTDDQASGGAIVELGVHEIDFIHWIGGPYKSLSALGSCTLVGPKFQDSVLSIGTLRSGALAQIRLSWSDPRYLWERGVQGEEGSIHFTDSNYMNVLLHRVGKEAESIPTGETDWMDRTTGENPSLRAQAEAALSALMNGGKPPVTLDDGYDAVAVAMAMRRSIQTNAPVQCGEGK